MRTLLALLALLTICPSALRADDEAKARGAKLLSEYQALKPELLGMRHHGVYMQGQMIGHLSFGLSKPAEGAPEGAVYGISMRGLIKFGGMTFQQSFDGTCDASFKPIAGKAREAGQEGVKVGKYAPSEGGWTWTGGVEGQELTTKQLTGAVGFHGLQYVLTGRWATLPANQPHALMVLSTTSGEVVPVTITNKGAAEKLVGTTMTKGVEVTFTETGKEGSASTLLIDAKTGAVLLERKPGAPIEVRMITEAECKGWLAKQDSTKTPEQAPAKKARSSKQVVADYFVAIATANQKALVECCDAKAFILNASIAGLPDQTPEAIAAAKQEVETKWAIDNGKTLCNQFFGQVIQAAQASSGGGMPKDPQVYLMMLQRKQGKGATHDIVTLERDGQVILLFHVHRKDATSPWKIRQQVQPGK